MEFKLVLPGTFRMGSPVDEIGREPQETQHDVTLTDAFYLGAYEVTQEQWQLVMGANPSAAIECGLRCPVENVNFYDVQEFLERLSDLSPGSVFRLPSEAEWEYVARAGTETPFSTGKTITTEQANFDGDYPYADTPPGIDREGPTEVGSFAPNPWGFYDMHGNVWEWCQDWHCPYPSSSNSEESGEALIDPQGQCASSFKVIRGGSWYFNAESVRSALRYTHRPQDLGMSLGFRVVREL